MREGGLLVSRASIPEPEMPISPLSFRFCIPLVFTVLPSWSGALAQASDRSGLFPQPERSTASADVTLDAGGVLHMAFVHYESDAEGAAAVYATCAGPVEACNDPASWRKVALLGASRDVQVAVTAEGHPRLLITANSTVQPGGVDYTYAECDAGCDQVSNWTLTLLATSWDNSMSAIMSGRLPARTFVLDPAGRPMFLYSDRNYLVEPDHYGTYWMACKATCTDLANWTETDLARHSDYDTEIFGEPVLALSPDGRPRVAARIYPIAAPGEPEGRTGLHYLACDTACTSPASWRRTWIVDTGGGSYPSPTWDLAIDPQGRPRIALFAGDGMEQADLSHSLIYLWCDETDCLSSDEAWNGNAVVGDGHGEMADLTLDALGRPRMAFRTSDGSLGYAWCDEACETAGTAWNGHFVEGQAELSPERPTALPFTCDGEVWEGLGPQLLLGSDGQPVVAYDVSVEGRCLYREFGEPEITYEFHPLWRGARLVSFAP